MQLNELAQIEVRSYLIKEAMSKSQFSRYQQIKLLKPSVC